MPITTTEPLDFLEALDKLSSKEIDASGLNTRERQIRANHDLDSRSFFSATVANADLLQEFKNSVNEIVSGKSDVATQRLALKGVLDKYDYEPKPGQEGTIQDLRSNERMDLILKTNTAMVRGYGRYQQDHTPAALTAFPASELFRVGARKIPRPWRALWDITRRHTVGTTATPSSSGRMAALKGDPIWRAISDFGVPWPPFKFNSGMGVINVDWNDALELGLVKEGAEEEKKPEQGRLAPAPVQKVIERLTAPPAAIKATSPAPRIVPATVAARPIPMNEGLAASVAGLDAEFLSVLAQTLAGSFVVGSQLFFGNDDPVDQLPNRSADEVLLLLELGE